MSEMNCGCKICSDSIRFTKEVYTKSGLILLPKTINLKHEYQQYVDVCDNCGRKARLFNEIEKTKLDLAKEQFKVLTEETVEEPEEETEPAP